MAGQRKVPIQDSEQQYMEKAITLAKKCRPEDGRAHPKVGVVIVTKDNKVLSAFRGQTGDGDHAEFAALDKKNQHRSFAGATVYTTLEPCSSRKPPKIDCAQRLIDAKVKKVWIGMKDPNPDIDGKGIDKLRNANIEVVMFDEGLRTIIESMNRNFRRRFSVPAIVQGHASKISDRERRLTLDDLYRRINSTYFEANIGLDRKDMMLILSESCDGIGQLVTQKRKKPSEYECLIGSFVNLMMLCGKVGVNSLADMVWQKFPFVCPYCYEMPHRQDICASNKKQRGTPDWERLRSIGESNINKRPRTLRAWQRMFEDIYPTSQAETEFGTTFARLREESSELSRSVRRFESEPDSFLCEAADLFAWLMRIPNMVDHKNQVSAKSRGEWLERTFLASYQDYWRTVNQGEREGSYRRRVNKKTMFMTAEQAREFFTPSSRAKRS